MLRLHDTATERATELVPSPSGELGLYVCGPTVYGPPHVGHGRLTLVFDVLRRYLESRGMRVAHVSNVTDIDDKIIERAQREDRSWQEVAEESEAQWWSAMDALGALRPHEIPHATAYIDQMIELVGTLLDRGLAYALSDGVYLSTSSIEGYGLLAHQGLETLRTGARVALDAEKRSPFDFALWKGVKPGEPSWPAPFGAGRPGWHTECVVMSLELLGEGFSLHGGGFDLVFPHHENERAQAVALGRPFTRHWMHEGLVTAGGEKMSKSLGNFLTLEALLERADARAYRLLVLRSKYRSPIEVTPELLEEAGRAIRRVDELARRLSELEHGPVRVAETNAYAEADALASRFVEAMDDDLDTAGALGALFEALRSANTLLDRNDTASGAPLGSAVLEAFCALGLEARGAGSGEPDEAVRALVAARDQARRSGDFGAADRARADIEALGWRVEDGPSGTRLRR